MAHEYFGLSQNNDRINILVMDGLKYVAETLSHTDEEKQLSTQEDQKENINLAGNENFNKNDLKQKDLIVVDVNAQDASIGRVIRVVRAIRVALCCHIMLVIYIYITQLIYIVSILYIYYNIGMNFPPQEFVTLSFLKSIYTALSTTGAMMLNLGARDPILQNNVLKTILNVFPQAFLCPVEDDVNVIVTAFKTIQTFSSEQLANFRSGSAVPGGGKCSNNWSKTFHQEWKQQCQPTEVLAGLYELKLNTNEENNQQEILRIPVLKTKDDLAPNSAGSESKQKENEKDVEVAANPVLTATQKKNQKKRRNRRR